jgi:hypothetical protein
MKYLSLLIIVFFLSCTNIIYKNKCISLSNKVIVDILIKDRYCEVRDTIPFSNMGNIERIFIPMLEKTTGIKAEYDFMDWGGHVGFRSDSLFNNQILRWAKASGYYNVYLPRPRNQIDTTQLYLDK